MAPASGYLPLAFLPILRLILEACYTPSSFCVLCLSVVPPACLQYLPLELNKYHNVDLFAGERAVSRAFAKRRLRSTALDIVVSDKDVAVLPKYHSLLCICEHFEGLES